MGGKNNFLNRLDREEASIKSRQNELKRKRRFYERCQMFYGDEIEIVLKHITPMISEVEGKEYVDKTFSMKEESHYETEWRSPYEGQYGVSGAELAATAEPHQVLVEGSSFQTRMILDKETCDTFGILEFSNCRDYRRNLARILATKKYAEIQRTTIIVETFSEMFPYVSTFLERLIEWRLDNETEDIPEDVMASIAKSVTDESISKFNKGTVKQNKKG